MGDDRLNGGIDLHQRTELTATYTASVIDKAEDMAGIRVFRKGASVVATSLALFGMGASCSIDSNNNRPGASRTAYAQAEVAVPITTSTIADIVQRVSPAVVTVVVTLNPTSDELPLSPLDELFRRFFDDRMQMLPQYRGPTGRVQTIGSGFVIDKRGWVVTSNHVVQEAREITVQLADNRKMPAKLMGRDEKTDLALLQIEPSADLQTVPWGNSDPVRVGEWIVALGNPFGVGQTATAGIVSAHHREIGQGPYDDFLQLDAPINQGNSGGPTVNLRGEVIGVNSVIVTPSGGSVGIGFAIPSNLARSVIDELARTGRIERGWIGVQIQEVTPDLGRILGLPEARGALVASVEQDGPAAEAGVAPGDVILSLDGKAIQVSRDLPRLVAELKAGTRSRLAIWRNGTQSLLTVTIGRMPEAAKPVPVSRTDVQSEGMTLTAVDARTRSRLGIAEGGALISAIDPRGTAAGTGLREGEVIVAVAQRPISSPAEAAAQIAEAKAAGASSVLLRIIGERSVRFVSLPLDQG